MYNDLKLDNLLLGLKEKFDSRCSIHMIDFGYATKYLNDGKHIEEATLDRFKGNLLFGSSN